MVISGPDARDFLHRLSTRNFKKEFVNIQGAFLNGQGRFISIFTAWLEEEKIYFFIEPSCFERTWNYLNKMHFAEDLKIEKIQMTVIEARGATSHPQEKEIEAYDWGIAGKYIFNPNKEYAYLSELEYDFLRANLGFPKPNVDITENHILIEAPLEKLIDREKGCYPGQEVIEKIYTYGRVAQKIFKIEFKDFISTSLPSELFNKEGEKIGFLTSAYQLGESNLGVGTIKRAHYDKSKECYLRAEKGSMIGTIV